MLGSVGSLLNIISPSLTHRNAPPSAITSFPPTTSSITRWFRPVARAQGYESALAASFPDARTELEDVFATPDRVVARYVFSGTLSGAAMMGAPAKGQKVRIGVIDIWTVKDGKLHEHWDQIDWTSYLAQLGVPGLPAPFYQIAGVTPPAAP